MISINFVGDFCVQQLGSLHINDQLNQILSTSQLNVVNMEGPIKCSSNTPIPKSGPNLYQDRNAPSFLEDNHFNIISFANNHIMDYGLSNFNETKGKFKSSVILGCGTWDEAYKIHRIKINNTTIGFLAITHHEFGVLDDNTYTEKRIGTAWLMHPDVDLLIIKAKKECDFLIILPHAGLEHFCLPLPELRTLYQHFINMGADAVIGGHPHVPGCWETHNKKPIVYSLGNFCFTAISSQNDLWNYGLLVTLSIDNTVRMNVKLTHYNPYSNTIEISNNNDIWNQLIQNNNLLNNKEEYIKAVERKCQEVSFMYDLWFEQSGYIKPQVKRYLKLIIQKLKSKLLNQKLLFKEEPLINNIRCETHRWVLSRLYEMNKNK